MEVCYNNVVFLSPSRQMAGYYKKLDDDYFLKSVCTLWT